MSEAPAPAPAPKPANGNGTNGNGKSRRTFEFAAALLESKTVGNLCLLFIVITLTVPLAWWLGSSATQNSRQTELLRVIEGSIRDREGFQTRMIDREEENRKLNEVQIASMRDVLANQQKIVEQQMANMRVATQAHEQILKTQSTNHAQMLADHQKIMENLCGKQTDKTRPMPDGKERAPAIPRPTPNG